MFSEENTWFKKKTLLSVRKIFFPAEKSQRDPCVLASLMRARTQPVRMIRAQGTAAPVKNTDEPLN